MSINTLICRIFNQNLLIVMCVCFLGLNAFWSYPLTNFLTDLLSLIGAVLGLYVLYLKKNEFDFYQKLLIIVSAAIIFWIIFHLNFLSNDYKAQLRELNSIWKRVFICMIFGYTLGFSLGLLKYKKWYLPIFFAGMLAPTIIFIFKYALNYISISNNWDLPDFVKLHSSRDSIFFMYKVDYVTFCLPALAFSLCEIKNNFNKKFRFCYLIYPISIFMVFYTFQVQNIKNGVAYGFIMTILFFLIMIHIIFKKIVQRESTLVKYFYVLITIFFIVLLGYVSFIKNVNNNPSWLNLLKDAKVGLEISKYDHWKYWGGKGYPVNENGQLVAATNYERVAWAVVGVKLIAENPLGYGLIERSFGFLTKTKWPDSTLDQSHSGWIDLALGLGIPGASLIMLLLLIALYCHFKISYTGENSNYQIKVWSERVLWILVSVTLFWFTSEISLKIYFIHLMFWIAFSYGILSCTTQVVRSKFKH